MSNRFAFIVHPVHRGSVLRRLKLMRKLPLPILEAVIRRTPPARCTPETEVAGLHSQALGCIITANSDLNGVVRLSAPQIAKKLLRAGRLAEKLGMRIVGLDSGLVEPGAVDLFLARHLRLAVTSGMSYTVATVLEGCLQAISLIGPDLEEAEVLVFGAAVSAGNILAQLLAREGVNYLTLVEGDRHRLENLTRRIMHDSGVACKTTLQARKAAGRADLILIAANDAVPAQIKVDDLKPGAIVCDLGRPRFFTAGEVCLRSDIFFFDGAAVELPGGTKRIWSDELPPGLVSAGLAETAILALEGRFENFSLGPELRVGKVEEIRRLGRKHGFKTAGLHYRGQMVHPAVFTGKKNISLLLDNAR
ncbi:MAG: shikimate dehydrogenase [Bacillota bacterium]